MKKKILLASKPNVSRREICPTHKPHNLGMLEWYADSERRAKKGMKQKQCKECKLWFYKDEM